MSKKTAEKYDLLVKSSRNRKLKSVPFSKMKVNLAAQRGFDKKWANEIFAIFDVDKMQTPHVSYRDGHFFIMDGQHTIEACKMFLGNWKDQMIDCWVYEGLSETEEADMYLALNNKKQDKLFNRFRVALLAGYETENRINEIVMSEGLAISNNKTPGAIESVGTLTKIYKRDGATVLGNILHIAKEAWGDAGLQVPIMDGIGLLLHRYNGQIQQQNLIILLKKVSGGVNGTLGAAEKLRDTTRDAKAPCVAGAIVSILNRSKTGKSRLAPWWKE